jgi:hypothetical protein
MQGLRLTVPNPLRRDEDGPGEYEVPELMAVLAACYYRYFNDLEFVRQQMDWCERHLSDALGRDIEDRLASDDNGNGGDDDDYNGSYNGIGSSSPPRFVCMYVTVCVT